MIRAGLRAFAVLCFYVGGLLTRQRGRRHSSKPWAVIALLGWASQVHAAIDYVQVNSKVSASTVKMVTMTKVQVGVDNPLRSDIHEFPHWASSRGVAGYSAKAAHTNMRPFSYNH